ncbi:MAG: PH domain-containing protein [Lysinibacillus sp.]
MDINYQQISPNSIKARNMSDLVSTMIGIIVIAVLLFCTYRFNWWSWLEYVWIGLIIISVLGTVWTYLVSSPLFFKTFRYAITDDFLYIKSGVWTHSEVVVPMAKIQSIELKQGAIMRKYNVSAVHVSTMQGEHEIPYIEAAVAKKVRDDIAKLARLKELDA